MKDTRILAAAFAVLLLGGCSGEGAPSDTPATTSETALAAVTESLSAEAASPTEAAADETSADETSADETTAQDTTEETTAETAAAVEPVDGSVCKAVALAVMDAVEFPSMAEAGADRIGSYLDCDLSQAADFAMYICGSGGFADEIFIVSKEGVDINAVEDAMNARIDSRINDFEDYDPNEVKKLEALQLLETDGYFMYAVSSDADKCIDTAAKMLG
ncbi:MAG: DUF4358 domain-containing protein [Oscillospiraceae bacterium]|nr:DUF4358 domain-containing protein [Oscillospiraceae bacterium]